MPRPLHLDGREKKAFSAQVMDPEQFSGFPSHECCIVAYSRIVLVVVAFVTYIGIENKNGRKRKRRKVAPAWQPPLVTITSTHRRPGSLQAFASSTSTKKGRASSRILRACRRSSVHAKAETGRSIPFPLPTRMWLKHVDNLTPPLRGCAPSAECKASGGAVKKAIEDRWQTVSAPVSQSPGCQVDSSPHSRKPKSKGHVNYSATLTVRHCAVFNCMLTCWIMRKHVSTSLPRSRALVSGSFVCLYQKQQMGPLA